MKHLTIHDSAISCETCGGDGVALDLLEAVEALFAARDALEAAPTHNNAAFDRSLKDHEAALQTLKDTATVLRRAEKSA